MKTRIPNPADLFKLKGSTAFSIITKTSNLSNFQKKFEGFLQKIKIDIRIINIIRGVFNYPRLIYNSKEVNSYE